MVVPSASADPLQAAACPSTSAELDPEDVDGANVLDCDLVGDPVTLDAVGLEVEVPQPGYFVSMDVLTDDAGLTEEQTSISLSVDESGDLDVLPIDVEPQASAPSACSDRAFATYATGGIADSETFKVNRGSVPNNVNAGNAVDAIVAAMQAWPNQYNDCDEPDQVSMKVVYGGDTNAGTGVSSDPSGGCDTSSTAHNSASVIGFGLLPRNFPARDGLLTVYGRTCRYGITETGGQYQIVAGDIRLNDRVDWTTAPDAADCQDQIDVRSVATHEAGHWWGLAHVDPGAHPNLTMKGGAGKRFACSSYMRTLGLGDIMGMSFLY